MMTCQVSQRADASTVSGHILSSSFSLLSSLEFGDTHVYQHQIRALLETASHFRNEVDLKLTTVPHSGFNDFLMCAPPPLHPQVCICCCYGRFRPRDVAEDDEEEEGGKDVLEPRLAPNASDVQLRAEFVVCHFFI